MVRIAVVGHCDLPAIAAMHQRAFPSSFLTALGKGSVERYYRWQLEGPHDCTAICATVNGTVTGFCFAGVFRGALSGFLRRHWAYLAVRVVLRGGLLWKRGSAGRFTQALRLIFRPAQPGTRRMGSDTFGILSIAVDPSCQGLGVGRHLMGTCERVARERGFSEMELVVATSNRQALRFYEKSGWSKQMTEGIWTGRMHKALA